MKQNLKHFYQNKVVPKLTNQFQYQNIHTTPQITKIVLNRGLGEKAQNAKILDSFSLELTMITRQRCIVTRARKAVAGFKIRETVPIGLIVTLRGDRIYNFIDRLINLALPRIRDFQGISKESFDGQGNYNFGFKEQLIFPEIRYDQVDQLCGINLSIVTNTKDTDIIVQMLQRLGMPFEK